VTGAKPEDLIASFRNSYNPRIAVTVDMVSTGTDIKPLEVLLFLRPVRSRVLFDQMVGRGTRVVSSTDLQAVTPDTLEKTHFVIVDAVGVVDEQKHDPKTMERKRAVPFDKLLERVALGVCDEDTLTTLAGRLARLERKTTPQDEEEVRAASGGLSLPDLANRLLDAVDPDQHLVAAQAETGLVDPTPVQITKAAEKLVAQATAPFDDPVLRQRLITIHQRAEQIIDTVSVDRVTGASFSDEQARATVQSFREFIEQNRDEITALQIIYSQPYARQRLTYQEVKELASQLELPPHTWTTESLWRAYAQLERDRVRGVGAQRVLADLVSLVRHAVELDDELVPYPDRVRRRYEDWLAAQEAGGRTFTEEQHWWLDQIAAHVGVNLSVSSDDFGYGELFSRGGWIAARRLFGAELPALLEELNDTLIL
jgi:type I restriction enzyme R subunit